MLDIPVKCTRCLNEHMESARVGRLQSRSDGVAVSDLCCPRCGGKSFYDLRPQISWCWASGLIEVGDALPSDAHDGSGAIEIARGPKAFLNGRLETLARRGRGASAGKLLVPGVPEADSESDKGDALSVWLAWCAKRNGKDGVFFVSEGCDMNSEIVIVQVRQTCGTYQTNTVRGLKASCTAGEQQAAQALGRKIFGDRLLSITQSPMSFSDGRSNWVLKARQK